MITIENYLMGRDKNYAREYSEEIKQNGEELLIKVNSLLKALRFENAKVSSGWRPPSYNRTVIGAAKGSHHTTGHAIDIKDPDGRLRDLILKEEFLGESLLCLHELYMEDPAFTPTWVHLQDIPPKSGKYIFKP